MEDGDFDQRLRDLQREYLEFLDDEVTFDLTFMFRSPFFLWSITLLVKLSGRPRNLHGKS